MREDIIISKKDQGVYKYNIGLKREITSVHPTIEKKKIIMFLMQYRTVKAFSLNTKTLAIPRVYKISLYMTMTTTLKTAVTHA